MKWSKIPARLLARLLIFATSAAAFDADAAESEWVHPGPNGKLVYKTSPAGDRIMDFSYAGYMGGGVALPNVPVKQTVQPSGGGEDADAIQAAIDAVAAMPVEDGLRGAVLLAPGTFACSKPITITANGVVLRGSGSGENGTTIKMTGGKHAAIVIGGGRGRQASDDDEPAAGQTQAATREPRTIETTVTDAYVPAGTNAFTVADARGFAVGDTIAIRRPTTAAWVKLVGMDTLTRDGRPQTWIGQNRSGVTERKITAIAGNKITVDIPLADSYDAKYLKPPGTLVSKVQPSRRTTQVGVEHLHIQCPPLEVSYGQAPYSAVRVGGDDCWVKDVYCEETMNSTVLSGKRITMQQVVVKRTFPNLGASKPTDFSIEGSQILIDRCHVTGGNTYFVWTASLYPGPNVLLGCTFSGHGSRIQPHMRWSTGMLVDNCTVPEGGIDFMNRGVAGSGHGWTMGWAVAWNCIANTYIIQKPPGAANWAIGCIGERVRTARLFDTGPILEEGIFDSYGTPVAPQSLYLAQLEERLGPQALANIGYSSNTESAFANKSVQRLPALATDTDTVLGPDLALHRPINTSGVRGSSREFGGENAVDADEKSYWATNDGIGRATLIADMEGPVEVNAVVIEPAPEVEQRVREYIVEGQVNSDWKVLSRGTTIDKRQVDRFPKATVWKVRLTMFDAQPYAAVRKFGLYKEPGR
jgi:hypothetical protein